MKLQLWVVFKRLLAYWWIGFVLMTSICMLVILIGKPMSVIFFNRNYGFLPSLIDVYKVVKFSLVSAFISGTVLWIREYFEKRS